MDALSQQPQSQSNQALLRIASVRERTGLTTTDIYNFMKDGTFPRNYPYPNKKRTKFWIESEITAWVQTTIESRLVPNKNK